MISKRSCKFLQVSGDILYLPRHEFAQYAKEQCAPHIVYSHVSTYSPFPAISVTLYTSNPND